MSYQPFPMWSIQDENGVPRVGAKVKFYIVGTNTPQAVYSDRARSVSLGTEITVDAAGNLEMFYFAEDAIYKAVITDADDNVLYTFNDLVTPGGTGTTIQRTSRATCPLDYGAIGDGVADESAEVQSAIDDATGDIDLAGKTYRCDDEIVLRSGLRFFGGKLTFNSHTGARCLSALGTLATSTLLTANSSPGDTVVAVTSASGLAAGDICYLGSTTDWDVSGTPANTGEIVKIQSVAGLNVTLVSNVIGEYLLAGSAYLRKINAVSDIIVEDVTVSGASTVSQDGIVFENATRIAVRNCNVIGMGDESYRATGVLDVRFSGCRTRGSNYAYGYRIEDARDVWIADCIADYAAIISFSVKGSNAVSRHVTFSNCYSEGSVYGFELQAGSQYCDVRGCHITGGAYGVLDAGSNNSVDSCFLRNCSTAAIRSASFRSYSTATGGGADPPSVTDLSGFNYSGNTIDLCGGKGISIAPQGPLALPIGSMLIIGNIIKGCDTDGILVELTDHNVSLLDISSNTFYEAQSNGVRIVPVGASTVTRLIVSGNNIDCASTTGAGIRIAGAAASSISLAQISNNIIRGYALCIDTDNLTSVTISNNTLTPASGSGSGIEMAYSTVGSDAEQVGITNNSIYNPGTYGVRITTAGSDLEDLSISSNRITGSMTRGISLVTASGRNFEEISINSNDIHTATAASKGIEVDGNTTAYSGPCTIKGNTIRCIAAAVVVSEVDSVDISTNFIVSDDGSGIELTNCKQFNVSGNDVSANDGDTQYCLLTSNTNASSDITRASVCGNQFRGGVSISTDQVCGNLNVSGNNINCQAIAAAVLIDINNPGSFAGVNISGNNIYGDFSTGGIAIDVATGSSLSQFSITTNNIWSADDGTPGISIVGAGTAAGVNGWVFGNMVFNGNNGLYDTGITITNSFCGGNYFRSTTAAATTTFTTSADLPNVYVA